MPIKTEKEKMLAGEVYNCRDPELDADRKKTKQLLRNYNKTESEEERQSILQRLETRVVMLVFLGCRFESMIMQLRA